MTADIEQCVAEFRRNRHHLNSFGESIRSFFAQHPALTTGETPVLHSIRYRLKDEDHLRDKLGRKKDDGEPVAPAELLQRINDLAGIRLLHLHQSQFGQIHDVIADQLSRRDWALHEPPVAYTWDPESKAFFEKFGLRTEVKESFYTSIHYVLKPREDSQICCELQVRTLFEEIWGEVDHAINYPHKTDSLSCSEQIRVLSRLVGAGSRLADSIFRAYSDHREQTTANRRGDTAGPVDPGALAVDKTARRAPGVEGVALLGVPVAPDTAAPPPASIPSHIEVQVDFDTPKVRRGQHFRVTIGDGSIVQGLALASGLSAEAFGSTWHVRRGQAGPVLEATEVDAAARGGVTLVLTDLPF